MKDPEEEDHTRRQRRLEAVMIGVKVLPPPLSSLIIPAPLSSPHSPSLSPLSSPLIIPPPSLSPSLSWLA
jgi:hypothetical protein